MKRNNNLKTSNRKVIHFIQKELLYSFIKASEKAWHRLVPAFGFVILLILASNAILLGEVKWSKTVERIKIDPKLVFAYTLDIAPVPNGYILLCNESSGTEKPMIFSVDKQGKLVSQWTSRGYGPGELNYVRKILVSKNSVFASEFYVPVIHEYSLDLKFKKDYRNKNNGSSLTFINDKWIGIRANATKKDTVFLISLYNRNTLEFEKYAYPISIKNCPALVQHDGNVCAIDKHTYAGVYPSEYQIKIFDENFDFKQNIIKKIPGHIKPYYPWKGSRSIVDQKTLDWMNSWASINSVLYIENYFILNYSYDGKFFIDIIDRNGNIILAKYEVKSFFTSSDGKYLYRTEIVGKGNEDEEFYIVKEKLDLKSLQNKK